MCNCTPTNRTPWCGGEGCEGPEKKYVKVPIELAFDHNRVIGWVEIEERYAKEIPKKLLSPGYIQKGQETELMCFGFIRAADMVLKKLDDEHLTPATPSPGAYGPGPFI